MPTYPYIRLIYDTSGKDEITLREDDLVHFPERSREQQRIKDGIGESHAEVRAAGELKGKAIFLNTMIGDPKIVIDSEEQTCLISIKKKEAL